MKGKSKDAGNHKSSRWKTRRDEEDIITNKTKQNKNQSKNFPELKIFFRLKGFRKRPAEFRQKGTNLATS